MESLEAECKRCYHNSRYLHPSIPTWKFCYFKYYSIEPKMTEPKPYAEALWNEHPMLFFFPHKIDIGEHYDQPKVDMVQMLATMLMTHVQRPSLQQCRTVAKAPQCTNFLKMTREIK